MSTKSEHAGKPGTNWTQEVRPLLPDLGRPNATGTERVVADDEWDGPSIRSNRKARRDRVARRRSSKRR